jgi:Protein of unknown function (DUF2281)
MVYQFCSFASLEVLTMSIAEIIYQHIKAMPPAKAVEVLHFVELLEAKSAAENKAESSVDLLEFIENLPVGNRTDAEITTCFQALRDEWN